MHLNKGSLYCSSRSFCIKVPDTVPGYDHTLQRLIQETNKSTSRSFQFFCVLVFMIVVPPGGKGIRRRRIYNGNSVPAPFLSYS